MNPINPGCWATLSITQYITDWWTSNSAKCSTGQSFAQCFLGTVQLGDNDCVGITSATCPPPNWPSFQSQNLSVEGFYVAYNIYAVWEPSIPTMPPLEMRDLLQPTAWLRLSLCWTRRKRTTGRSTISSLLCPLVSVSWLLMWAHS